MIISRTRQLNRPIVALVFGRCLSAVQRCTASNNTGYSINRLTQVEQLTRFSNSATLRSENMSVSYEDVLEAQNDENVLIIDVREQFEIDETGKLPGSIHIPMADVSDVLSTLSETDFKEKYGRDKPTKDTKIILSCRSGKRSGMVQEMIRTMGYENAYNYTGGFIDWERNEEH